MPTFPLRGTQHVDDGYVRYAVVAAADVVRTAAEAMVRAGHSVHGDDRPAGVYFALTIPDYATVQNCRFAGCVSSPNSASSLSAWHSA